MNFHLAILALPRIPLHTSFLMCLALVLAAVLAPWATPHLTVVTGAPSLEDTVPRQFGDWKVQPSPYVQVSLSTGTDPNMDQPYDQTVMRTYVNSRGQQVMLALAWGKRQRQEVKIHRPDLCYIAQGYQIKSLETVQFEGLRAPQNNAIIGKHMYVVNGNGGEAVSYWIRIGALYSEDALATRLHILYEGFNQRIPDGILVRASVRTRSSDGAGLSWPLMDSFLSELVANTPRPTRQLLVGND